MGWCVYVLSGFLFEGILLNSIIFTLTMHFEMVSKLMIWQRKWLFGSLCIITIWSHQLQLGRKHIFKQIKALNGLLHFSLFEQTLHLQELYLEVIRDFSNRDFFFFLESTNALTIKNWMLHVVLIPHTVYIKTYVCVCVFVCGSFFLLLGKQ